MSLSVSIYDTVYVDYPLFLSSQIHCFRDIFYHFSSDSPLGDSFYFSSSLSSPVSDYYLLPISLDCMIYYFVLSSFDQPRYHVFITSVPLVNSICDRLNLQPSDTMTPAKLEYIEQYVKHHDINSLDQLECEKIKIEKIHC